MKHAPQLNEHGLYDIYEFWHTPWWQTSVFYIIVSLLCAVIIFACLYWLIRVYSARAVRKESWDIALIELESIKDQHIDTVEKAKKTYEYVCWILKKYLSARFALELFDKTEQEVIDIMTAGVHMQPELLHDVDDILHGGSLVKFANVSVAKEQVLRAIDRSIAFVRLTVPTAMSNNN